MHPRKPRSVRWTWAVAAAGAAWLVAAAPLHAQQPPKADGASQADIDRAEMQERLARRITELEARTHMLRQAMQRLESGEDLDSVRDYVRDHGANVGRLLADHEAAREIDRLEGRPPPHDGAGSPPPPGRHRGPGGHWRDRAEAGGPLSDEERQVVREMLAVTDPDAWPALEQLRRAQPGEADKRVRRLLVVAGPMIELRRRDPELYRLRLEQMRWERQVMGTVHKIVSVEHAPGASKAELERLAAELRDAGGRAFDMRIAVQAHEVGKLQERLAKLHAEIREQQEQRDSLIAQHTRRLLEWARQRRHDDLHGGPRDDMEGRPAAPPHLRRAGPEDAPPPEDSPRHRPPRRDAPR